MSGGNLIMEDYIGARPLIRNWSELLPPARQGVVLPGRPAALPLVKPAGLPPFPSIPSARAHPHRARCAFRRFELHRPPRPLHDAAGWGRW